MRILLIHNFYGSEAPSGENRAFLLEKAMLEKNGHEVQTYTTHSDNLRKLGVLGNITGAIMTPWNPMTYDRVRRIVKKFKPDIVHAHNTFPIISPSIFYAAGDVARVLTLHNYRLFCSAAIPMRNGVVCTNCIDKKSVFSSVQHGCYRGSGFATLPIAAKISLHRSIGTWNRAIDSFVALSEFQKNLISKGGIDPNFIQVKPNFFPGTPDRIPYSKRKNSVVFAGRISEEKGIDILIEAWKEWGPDAPYLEVLGDGPLKSKLEKNTKGINNISFLGKMDSSEAEKIIGNSRLLILPSIWFEGFPMVVREALALGTPIAVSNIGPLPTIAELANGVVFEPGNSKSLVEMVQSALSDKKQMIERAAASIRAFEQNFSETTNHNILMNIYKSAIEKRRSRK
ncbi:glycosyltransferase family 4 protein [Hirschia baltica]|uniref:Glycosyl transferase group 1 n=1 Tax=Hirschia baltica (strain ATCC 49814 / DSM 5838 / IFAM 1418) TaxID=582402 RepID=C6XK26_HIRBI|nr:glycosyltransferase family 4 protein [Hirschia baltica]ACT59471.1 glycosyl transferase group 1 [Hirschia baltica ATCC 49814]